MASIGLDQWVDRANITWSFRWWRRRITDALILVFGPKNPFGDVATRPTWHPNRDDPTAPGNPATWKQGDVLITGGDRKIPISHLPGLTGISGVTDYRLIEETVGNFRLLGDVDIDYEIDASGRVLVETVTQTTVNDGSGTGAPRPPRVPTPARCSGNDDCPAGFVCEDGKCVRRCSDNEGCPVNFRCEDGNCVPIVEAPCIQLDVASPIHVKVGETLTVGFTQYGGCTDCPISVHVVGARTVSSVSLSGSSISITGTRKSPTARADSYVFRYRDADGKFQETRCTQGFQVTTTRSVAPRCPPGLTSIPERMIVGSTYSARLETGATESLELSGVYGGIRARLAATGVLAVDANSYGDGGFTITIKDSATQLSRDCLVGIFAYNRPCIEYESPEQDPCGEDPGSVPPKKPTCSGGRVYVDGECKCPAGEEWNSVSQRCIRGKARPRCADGERWNPTTMQCEKDRVPPRCPAGQEWNATTMRCEPKSKLPPPPPQCPPGYAYNPFTKKCAKIPVPPQRPVPVREEPDDPTDTDDGGGI